MASQQNAGRMFDFGSTSFRRFEKEHEPSLVSASEEDVGGNRQHYITSHWWLGSSSPPEPKTYIEQKLSSIADQSNQ